MTPLRRLSTVAIVFVYAIMAATHVGAARVPRTTAPRPPVAALSRRSRPSFRPQGSTPAQSPSPSSPLKPMTLEKHGGPTLERDVDIKSKLQALRASKAMAGLGLVVAIAGLILLAESARSATIGGSSNDLFNFNPVCPASDGVFRLGQRAAVALAGDQNVEDYRPLINDVLIRVRTELCVLESFMRETAFPFIQKKGLGWILPAHETSETYVAGVVFVVGANFILLGSTKILAILSIYHDIVLGLPTRATSYLLNAVAEGGGIGASERDEKKLKKIMDEQFNEVKKAMEKLPSDQAGTKVAEINAKYSDKIENLRKKQTDRREKAKKAPIGKASRVAAGVAVPLKVYGELSRGMKQVLEAFDTFCSRYLVATTVVYTLIKSVHFWVFPDFP